MKRFIKNFSVAMTVLLVVLTATFGSVAAAKATSLSFSKTGTAKVAIGKSFTRAAVVSPKDLAVEYTSSDASVAAVDKNGRVTGKTPGKAVITASSGGLKASYNVTVAPVVRFLESSELTLNVGAKNVRKATASPAGKIAYKSSDPAVADVDSGGQVTAKSQGTAKITASCSGGSASYNVTVVDYRQYENENNSYDNGRNQPGSGGASGTGKAKDSFAKQVVPIVNKHRSQKGLGSLEMDDGLSEYAQLRAEEIVELFSHTRPDGSSATDAVPGFRDFYITVGENIAWGQKNPSEVMTAWMNSKGHRANIMNEDFTHIGVGCYEYNGRLYWVQIFAG